MKKFLSFVFAFMLCLTATFTFAGCNKEDNSSGKVMNVSLNPEVEFVLDKDNKVVSVNAKNEEGNIVIVGQWDNFVGLTDVEAVKKFIELAKEYGYVIEGQLEGFSNEIKIALSGTDTKEQFEKIQNQINSFLEEQDFTATLTKLTDLTNQDIDELIQECAPYIEQAKLNAMSAKEKINEIAKSREETKELYSQELKNAYYLAKEKAFLEARAAYVASVDALTGTALAGVTSAYTQVLESIEQAVKTNLVDENSAYQQALATVRTKKVEYLNRRQEIANSDLADKNDLLAELAVLEQALAAAEDALEEAYNTAMQFVNQAKEGLSSAYSGIIEMIEMLSSKAKTAYDNAEQNIKTQLDAFEQSFATNYQNEITSNLNAWNEMRNDLTSSAN